MQKMTVILAAMLVAACSSDQPPLKGRDLVKTEVITPSDVSGTMVQPDALPFIRTPERVRAYTVGRYIDPITGTMQERTMIYRVEDSSTWMTDPPPGKYQLPYADMEPYRRPAPRLAPDTAATEIEDLTHATRRMNRDAALTYNQVIKAAAELKEKQDMIRQRLESEVVAKKQVKEQEEQISKLQAEVKDLNAQLQLLIEQKAAQQQQQTTKNGRRGEAP